MLTQEHFIKQSLYFSCIYSRQQCTHIATSLSPLTKTYVIQMGSILDPVLFVLHLIDAREVIKLSNIESYVDDTKIYRSRQKIWFHAYTSLFRISHAWLSGAAQIICESILIRPSRWFFGVTQLIFEMPGVTEPFLGQDLTSLSSAKDMCVVLNSNIPFNDHVASFNYFLYLPFWYLYSRGVLYKSWTY